MKKFLLMLIVLLLLGGQSYAALITLDFTSGAYDADNALYTQDGFTVAASHGFHSVPLGTLAWYEGDNILTVASGGSLFDLDNLTVVNPSFAGLVFESSKGGYASFGLVSGPLTFAGDAWEGMAYFTITTLTHVDILNQIDNVNLSTVPLPSSLVLLLSAIAFLLAARTPWIKRGRSICPARVHYIPRPTEDLL